MLGNAGGADQAFVVHHGRGDVAGRARGHNDTAAVGLDEFLVLGQRVQRGLIHCQADQAVAGEVERDLVAGGKRRGTQTSGDDAFVAHFRGEQGNVSAIRCPERALVDDRTCRAAVGEGVTAGEEVRVRDIQRRGDQAADVHLCGLAEEHAARVDQEHLPVGGEPALNVRSPGRGNDAVERDRACAGLREVHQSTGADVETGPVEDRTLARLIHAHAAAGLRDGCGTGSDLPAGG